MSSNPDLHRIHPRHDAVHARLEAWGRWVKVVPKEWGTQPMFRGYQSKARHWEVSPHIHVPVNTMEALAVEREVALLPDRHRDALRWFYVASWVHPGVVMRRMGVSADELYLVLHDARDMLANRMKKDLQSA